LFSRKTPDRKGGFEMLRWTGDPKSPAA